MDIPLEESNKRQASAKIDPVTNIVYHPEHNPAPHDNKLVMDRLTKIVPEKAE